MKTNNELFVYIKKKIFISYYKKKKKEKKISLCRLKEHIADLQGRLFSFRLRRAFL